VNKSLDEIIHLLEDDAESSLLPSKIKAELKLLQGGEVFKIKKNRVILGRGRVDLQIKDPLVSDRHAAIGYFDGFFFLIDLKSKNGTYINGKKVQEKVLLDKDEIQLGETWCQFCLKGEVPESRTELLDDEGASIDKILTALFEERKKDPNEPTRIIISKELERTIKAPLVELKFEIVDGSEAGKVFHFAQNEIRIGRESGDLSLIDPDVSKEHAQIEIYGKDQVYIKDLGSLNGSYVNSRKMDRMQLKDGDKLQFGGTSIKVSFGKVREQIKGGKQEGQDLVPKKTTSQTFVSLKVVSGSELGKVFELTEGAFTMGHYESDICLNDPEIGEDKAILEVSKNAVTIKSAVGVVKVNSRVVKRCAISTNDQIAMGRTVLKVHLIDRDDEASITDRFKLSGLETE
jgi:pSer/pThr/pTyr-binding forkhead associated (FHA) protein